MIKLKCIRDVIMTPTGEVAFKAGQEYDFNMNAHGEISQKAEMGVHMFRVSGPEAWVNYFKFEMESAS